MDNNFVSWTPAADAQAPLFHAVADKIGTIETLLNEAGSTADMMLYRVFGPKERLYERGGSVCTNGAPVAPEPPAAERLLADLDRLMAKAADLNATVRSIEART